MTHNYTDYPADNSHVINERIQKENIYIILEKINLLYESVIEEFRKGNDKIFNPNLFIHLTIDDFRNWIILNNPELKNIFN